MWAQTQNPHLCHYANDPFCLWSYQDRHVWSRPKPEQDVQQGSYCCSSIFRKLSPTCLQGLRVSVTRPATSSGSNPVQRQMLLTILPSLCSVALEVMVVIFALLSMCCQNLTTEVKKKIHNSDFLRRSNKKETYLTAQSYPTCNCSKQQKRWQPDVFGRVTWTCQRTFDHQQQKEILRLKDAMCTANTGLSSFIWHRWFNMLHLSSWRQIWFNTPYSPFPLPQIILHTSLYVVG